MMRVIGVIGGSLLLINPFPASPLLAKCPVSDGAVLFVRAPIGDVQVDTSSREAAVDVQVDNSFIQVQENCGKDIELTSNVPEPAQVRGTILWRIVAPRNVNLDLVATAGNINVGDVDGNAILRTTGGHITAGQINGKAALIAEGGFVKAGNVGGDAEIRSQDGTLEVGDVGGNAEFHTTAGQFRAGSISGSVTAEGGRAIFIIKAGDVQAMTNAGDISIGDAARINAKTAGGSITSRRVRVLSRVTPNPAISGWIVRPPGSRPRRELEISSSISFQKISMAICIWIFKPVLATSPFTCPYVSKRRSMPPYKDRPSSRSRLFPISP